MSDIRGRVRIRPAGPADVPVILGMIRELAEFERDPEAVVATPELLYDALFGVKAVAHAIMAEEQVQDTTQREPAPLGFALYFFNFSTWTGRRGLYLEDFYVQPSARGQGVGRQLFARLATIARESSCGRMELAVLNWNVNAIRFYERAGGVALGDWTHYRFDTDAIAMIASTGGIPETA
jgi:GNAT superfamily N-acetyltransferase